MFWKVVGGIVAFFAVMVLGVLMAATFGVLAIGSIVGNVVENVDINNVQVTDANGNVETIDIEEFFSESGSFEVVGDNGEIVTIDLDLPQITVQESGHDEARIIIGSNSEIEIGPNGPEIRIDEQGFGSMDSNFDGGFVGNVLGSFIKGVFTLMTWVLIIGCAWLLLRKQQPATVQPSEKKVDASAE